MKVRYTTTRETAAVLKEWAGNCGSGLDSMCAGGMASAARALADQRNRPVESFMSGEVDADAPTAECVLLALAPAGRKIRPATIAKLASSITVKAMGKAYLNEFTHEYWRGDEDRAAAPDYVTRLPMSSMSAPLQYAGRIGGVRTDDQAALLALRAEILADVFGKKG